MQCRNCCSVWESICITTLMLVHHCREIVRHSGAMALPQLLAWTREHVMGIKG
jgi:thioredoxin 2